MVEPPTFDTRCVSYILTRKQGQTSVPAGPAAARYGRPLPPRVMMAAAIQKICVICGADAAKVRRTKDAAGNYYCQTCYDATRSHKARPTDDDLADLEGLAASAAVQTLAAPDLYTCPTCQGMFALMKMSPTGVCRDCSSKTNVPRQTTGFMGPSSKYGFRVVVGLLACVAVVVGTYAYFLFQSTNEAKLAADRKAKQSYDKLVKAAEDKLEAVRQNQPAAPERPTVVTRPKTRSELVDEDPILSSIASRAGELDDALRGRVPERVGYNSLRAAWNSANLISFEEYQYAQSFRHKQGEYP